MERSILMSSEGVEVMDDKCAPLEWIKEYVQQLMRTAEQFPEGARMRLDMTQRTMHVIDMVETWKESLRHSHHQ